MTGQTHLTPPPRNILRTLAGVHTDGDGVLSLYVDLDPSVFPTRDGRRTEIEILVDEAEKRFVTRTLPHDERDKRVEAVGRIRDILNDPGVAKGGTRAVAVFAAPSQDVFEVIKLPEPITPAVIVDNSPHLRPLTDDAGPRSWAVLLADRRRTRLLFGGPGGLVEVSSFEDNVPSHQKQGGWSAERYQRHSDEAATDHFENTVTALHDFFERSKFEALAIASPDPDYDELVGMLHPNLRERLRGRIHIEVAHPTPAQILDEASDVFDEARVQAVNEILDRIAEASREHVTIGATTTFAALSERRVETLVIDEGFTMKGRRCDQCGWIGVDEVTCPFDQATTEVRDDIVDDAVDLALGQSARVITIDGDAERHADEPIAAITRF